MTECRYVSAPEAWDEFAADYFEGYEEAGEDFRESMVADNPLANSAHYEVYVNAVENQSQMVEYIEGLEGVREVNRSEQGIHYAFYGQSPDQYCLCGDYRHFAGGFCLPDQQHGCHGNFCPQGRNRNYEADRSYQRFCAAAVYSGGYSHRPGGSGDSADPSVFSV